METLKAAKPKILVMGDLMIDHYLWGTCDRISPEAPVQVVDIEKQTISLGGAGNVINNLKSLGADVDVCSVIGDDENAAELYTLLEKIDVSPDKIVVETGRKTSKKSRIIAAHQQMMRYDSESKNNISKDSEKLLYTLLENNIASYDSVILSDYGKGVLTQDLCQKVITLARNNNVRVFVDPKGSDYSKYRGAFLLTPNRKEAEQATNIRIYDKQSLTHALLKLKNECDLDISLITLSEDGIAIYKDELRIFPTAAKEVYDVTGAGDTVIASMTFALSVGKDIDESVKFANLAAGVVVGKVGSVPVTIEEIEDYEASLHKSTSDTHIKSFDEIKKIVKRLKSKGKKIVFTNGCFDILHVGHVKYLEQAKSYGDVLIVGLNSDDSVKRLKGPSRPINTAEDRGYLLAALESVDYVVPFEDDTPYDLIKSISPDILVKGGDYEGKKVVGEEFAGQLILVKYVNGKSTTGTIEKIKNGNQ